MYHFEYVTRKEAAPYRQEIEDILHQVQDLLRNQFTFGYSFIGSSARNMITYDPTTNVGFDFDVNVYPNDDDNEYTPREIKLLLINAINRVAPLYGFRHCENSTRVITFKKINLFTGAIKHSCDIAIVHDYVEKKTQKQEYIRYVKKTDTYQWVDQPKGYNITARVEWIKKNKLWDEVFDLYLDKKNNNDNPNKKSRALYAETINEICLKNGYRE